VSPSVIDSVGHSGKHAPQAMHSSVIFIAMSVFSFFEINPADLHLKLRFV
jgi:hypothetical protein